MRDSVISRVLLDPGAAGRMMRSEKGSSERIAILVGWSIDVALCLGAGWYTGRERSDTASGR